VAGGTGGGTNENNYSRSRYGNKDKHRETERMRESGKGGFMFSRSRLLVIIKPYLLLLYYCRIAVM
jgi:hypothetical protein